MYLEEFRKKSVMMKLLHVFGTVGFISENASETSTIFELQFELLV